MLSDYGKMDVMLGGGNSSFVERELDSLIKVPERQQDFQSFPNRENSSEENEIRDIDSRNEPVREGRLMESINMLSKEMNARMFREIEMMIDLMHTQISRAIGSAMSERIIPEIQNMVESLPLNQHGVEPYTSKNEDGTRNVWKNANTKLTKKDSRSACDLRDHTDNVPYSWVCTSDIVPDSVTVQLCFLNGMRKTRRKQLVEIKGRKTGRKLTRRTIIECKFDEKLQITHQDYPVLIRD